MILENVKVFAVLIFIEIGYVVKGKELTVSVAYPIYNRFMRTCLPSQFTLWSCFFHMQYLINCKTCNSVLKM